MEGPRGALGNVRTLPQFFLRALASQGLKCSHARTFPASLKTPVAQKFHVVRWGFFEYAIASSSRHIYTSRSLRFFYRLKQLKSSNNRRYSCTLIFHIPTIFKNGFSPCQCEGGYWSYRLTISCDTDFRKYTDSAKHRHRARSARGDAPRHCWQVERAQPPSVHNMDNNNIVRSRCPLI
jgi:hypothetical protein